MAGVSLPDSPLITEAFDYARQVSEPYLFNHAVRSWLFAANVGHLKNIDCDLEVVAIGTLLHDIGLTAAVSGPNRFEVNGAAAAQPPLALQLPDALRPAPGAGIGEPSRMSAASAARAGSGIGPAAGGS